MNKRSQDDCHRSMHHSASWAQLIDIVTLLLLPIALLATAMHNIVSTDIWWQLATGRWVLDHGFPATDPFSYAFPDRTWIELRWLYTVIIRLLFENAGLNSLIFAKLLVLAAILLILYRLVPGRGVAIWPKVLGLTTTLALLFNRTFVRPELLTYLFLMLFLFASYRYKQNQRLRWLVILPIFQIIWVNNHTLFILGPITLGLLALGETVHAWLRPILVQRWPNLKAYFNDPVPVKGRSLIHLWLAALATAVACLVNPYFLEGALFPLTLFGEISRSHVFTNLISEFVPTLQYAGFNLTFLPFGTAVLLAGLGLFLNRNRLSLGLSLLWLAFLYLSLLAIRNVALFGIVTGPVIIINFSQWAANPSVEEEPIRPLMPWLARGLVFVYILFLVPTMLSNIYFRNTERRFGLGVAAERFPIRAVQFAQEEALPWPLLHNLGDGSYLIFAGGPGAVYVDGRLEVYDPANVEQAVNMFQNGQGLLANAQGQEVDTILVRHYADPAVLDLLHQDPTWRPVYYDSHYALFVHQTEATSALLDRLAFDWSDPPAPADESPSATDTLPDWLSVGWPDIPEVESGQREARLGQLFLITENTELATRYLREALILDPNNAVVARQLQQLEN